MEKWTQVTGYNRLPYTILTTAASYLDWILMTGPQKNPLFQVTEVPVESLVRTEVLKQIEKRMSKEELLGMDITQVYDEAMEKQLKNGLNYLYPYKEDINLYTKMTVSELKRMGQEADDFDGLCQPKVPDYLTEEQSGTQKEMEDLRGQGENREGIERHRIEEAAKRGSAYHRILELMDFTAVSSREDVQQQLKGLLDSQKISQEGAKKVRQDVIWRFASSPLGRRLVRAQAEGKCRREQQFIMGIPAKEIGAGDSEEPVLIQGIIDAYLEEEDGLVLIDYKTDHIPQGQEEILVKRYRTQMDYYQKALEQIAGKKVKQRIIYSLSLQKEVTL